jgi:hypothetical protein
MQFIGKSNHASDRGHQLVRNTGGQQVKQLNFFFRVLQVFLRRNVPYRQNLALLIIKDHEVMCDMNPLNLFRDGPKFNNHVSILPY